MKFIRNIIAEKANRAEEGQDGGASDDPNVETDLRQAFALRDSDEAADVDADDFDLLADVDSAPDWREDDLCEHPDVPVRTDQPDDVKAEGDANYDQRPPRPETNSQAVMRTIYHPGPPLSEADLADLDRAEAKAAQKSRQEAARKSIQQQADQERPISAFQKIMQRETALPGGEDTPQRQYSQTATPVARTAPTIPAPLEATPARNKAGRVKTRLLGFGNDFGGEPDLFANGETTAPAPQIKFPVGWMVIVSGPGRGTAFTLFDGVSQIGRGEDQAVRLDFGDTSISRSNHAAIAYDPEQQSFYLGHGGKANLLRLNGNPVLSTEPLADGAEIRLGETTLRFVGLCGSAFDWGKTEGNEGDNAQFD